MVDLVTLSAVERILPFKDTFQPLLSTVWLTSNIWNIVSSWYRCGKYVEWKELLGKIPPIPSISNSKSTGNMSGFLESVTVVSIFSKSEVLKPILSMNCCFSLFLASYFEEYKLIKGEVVYSWPVASFIFLFNFNFLPSSFQSSSVKYRGNGGGTDPRDIPNSSSVSLLSAAALICSSRSVTLSVYFWLINFGLSFKNCNILSLPPFAVNAGLVVLWVAEGSAP